MNRLWRYIFIQSLIGILASAAVIVAVILLIDYVETSRDIATRADINALEAFQLTLLKAPLLVQETTPFIILFGVLFTFFRLSRRSELIVMRASGYSAWRIVAPAAALCVVLGAASTALLNPIGAQTNAQFEQIRERVLDGQVGEAARPTGDIWLREVSADGFIIITADRLEPEDSSLINPVFRRYRTTGGAPDLERLIRAESARLASGFWQLSGAVEAEIGQAERPIGTVGLPTRVQPQALFERARSPGAISFWDLPDVIDSARAAGLSSRPYELRFHGLLSQPLLLLAASLVAAAATFRLHRMGGAARFAAAGAVAGFGLYFTQELLLGLGASGALNPVTAAWTAPAVFAMAGLFFIALTEDG
jgi:lipopolysaccharide export system permease protein